MTANSSERITTQIRAAEIAAESAIDTAMRAVVRTRLWLEREQA